MTQINMPDFVGDVIRVGADCYQFAGFSSGSPDASSPDAVFGTCEDCAAGSGASSGADTSAAPGASSDPGPSAGDSSTPAPIPCPTDCSTAPSSYTVIYTNTGGTTCLPGTCAGLSQTLQIFRGFTTSCIWGEFDAISIECIGSSWIMTITDFTICDIIFEAPNTTGSPPTSGWVKQSGNCIGTVSVSTP